MKDDEYFGFSMNGNFKEVNLPDDVSATDLKLVELVDFASDDDIRIVSLDDVDQYHKNALEEDTGPDWIDHFDPVKPKPRVLPSSSALEARCTHTRYIVKSMIVTGLVMMGMLVFLGNGLWLSGRSTARSSSMASSTSRSTTMAPVIAPPANAAPLIIDTSHYYIQLGANWTQILLDGHALLHVPISGVDSPLWIAAGHHLVMWQLSDHRTLSCTMTVPPSLTDTCAYDGPEPLRSGVSVWIITFPHFDGEYQGVSGM